MKIKQNRKWALKPEVGIFETRDPAQAEEKLLRIILSYSTALCMVWVKPQFDSNLRQKHPIFGLWEFLENSRGTLEGKFINVFYSARRALSDPQDSLVTKILLVVENFSLSHFVKIALFTEKFDQSRNFSKIRYLLMQRIRFFNNLQWKLSAPIFDRAWNLFTVVKKDITR